MSKKSKTPDKYTIIGSIILVFVAIIISLFRWIIEVLIEFFSCIEDFLIDAFDAIMTFKTKNPEIFLPISIIVSIFILVLLLLLAKKINKNHKIRMQIKKTILEKERRSEINKRIAREELRKKMESVKISDNRHDYIITNEDYKRGNQVDNDYRKTWYLTLLKIYDNKCANCGNTKNGCDLDHFVFPKNEGGNFVMKHKDGFLVNNAIPLCQNCNRSKSDKNYKNFFSLQKIAEILIKNAEMTKLLNSGKY